jgi:predicted esterase
MRELARLAGAAEVEAPDALGSSWYPQRFIAPRAANEPHLSAALDRVDAILDDLVERGIAPGRIVLGGFSQGACLAAEVLARRPRPLGALAVLCGGLIGAGEDELAHPPPGALAGVPVLLTGTVEDAWVPVERVRRTAEILQHAGADVDLRVHPRAPHQVHASELEALRALLERVRVTFAQAKSGARSMKIR